MLHSPGREGQEKTGKEIAKFSAVCDSIRGKWKAVCLEALYDDPGNNSFLSSRKWTVRPPGLSQLRLRTSVAWNRAGSMTATMSAESCSWKGKQDTFQTKMGHSTSPKVVTEKGKRSSILKMANNLAGQIKETDLNTNHIKEALRKVNGRSKLAWS